MKLTAFLAFLAVSAATAAASDFSKRQNSGSQRLRKNRDGRNLEGEIPMMPPSSAEDDFVENIFTPAMDLDFFRNLDPADFEWVEPKEIQPGETTCGFLHAPLGSLPDVTYPIVDVYVCVKVSAPGRPLQALVGPIEIAAH